MPLSAVPGFTNINVSLSVFCCLIKMPLLCPELTLKKLVRMLQSVKIKQKKMNEGKRGSCTLAKMFRVNGQSKADWISNLALVFKQVNGHCLSSLMTQHNKTQ